jgi:hypothetical protein
VRPYSCGVARTFHRDSRPTPDVERPRLAEAAIELRRASKSAAETARLLGVSSRHVRRLTAGADLSPTAPAEPDTSQTGATAGQRRGLPPGTAQDPATGRFHAKRQPTSRVRFILCDGQASGPTPREYLERQKIATDALSRGLVRLQSPEGFIPRCRRFVEAPDAPALISAGWTEAK